MEEITFEELTEKFRVYNESDFKIMSYRESVVELLKQVREATIEECTKILLNPDFNWSGEIENQFNKIPTDRIKIKP